MKEIVNRLQEQRQIELAKSTLESKGYRVKKKSLNESRNPEVLSMMGYIDNIFQDSHMQGNSDQYEEILMKYNASPDDSDREEGYFVTMSDDDIRGAYAEITSIGELSKGELSKGELSKDDLIKIILDAIWRQGDDHIESAKSFDDAFAMTNSKGFVVYTPLETEYHFKLVKVLH